MYFWLFYYNIIINLLITNNVNTCKYIIFSAFSLDVILMLFYNKRIINLLITNVNTYCFLCGYYYSHGWWINTLIWTISLYYAIHK